MTSFNFGANDKQPKLPFEEIKNEENKNNQGEGETDNKGIDNNDKTPREIQMEIRPGDNKPSTGEQTTLPDSGYRYPD